MSHVASVDCFVTNLEELRAVADRLGFTLVEGAKNYAWYGRFMNDSRDFGKHDPATFGTCEHKLRMKDHIEGQDYEIGLVARLDGQPGWEMLYDNWGPGQRLHERAGVGLATMKDEIAAEAATRAAQRKGYRVRRTVNADGKLQLRITV